MRQRSTARDHRMRGSSTTKIDARGRVRIPQPFRAILSRLGTSCYLFLFPSPRAGIGVFALRTWHEVVSGRRRAALPSRVFCGETRTIDGRGWITLPEEFLVATQLPEHVLVLGYGEYLTLSNPEAIVDQLSALALADDDVGHIPEPVGTT